MNKIICGFVGVAALGAVLFAGGCDNYKIVKTNEKDGPDHQSYNKAYVQIDEKILEFNVYEWKMVDDKSRYEIWIDEDVVITASTLCVILADEDENGEVIHQYIYREEKSTDVVE